VLLGKGAAMSLSPDGRSALVLNLSPPTHLVVLPTGAGEARSLPTGSLAQFHWAAFFADGKHIAITGNEANKGPRIWVQDLDGGDPRAISGEGVGFAEGNPVSPDGLFVAGESEAGLALYPVAGGEPRSIQGADQRDTLLRFSRDGHVLYVRERTNQSQPSSRIFRIDLATGTRELWRTLSPTGASPLGNLTSMAIAPDTGAHAYTYMEQSTTLYEVSGLGR
jgi:Tol biopolymer transport system component